MKKLKSREEFLNEGHSYDNEIEKARMMQGSASELVEWAVRKVAESKPENFKEGVNEGATPRLLKSAGQNLARQVKGIKNYTEEQLKDRLLSTPLAKMLSDDDILTVLDHAKKELGMDEAKINEASRRKVYKAAKQGSYPAVIVVIQDGKVIHQEPVSTPDVAPATFNVMQEKYPKALIHLEDKTGKRLFSESVVAESFADPLEEFPQAYKDLLKKLQRSNDRGERSMLINKMNVIRKKLKLKPLTTESLDEADDNWSDDVKTKWTPPAGLFTEPANKIADVLHKESDDLDQAMSRLQFYINRGGKLLDGKAKANLETAKKLLQQKYD